jgi:hypothetical protein
VWECCEKRGDEEGCEVDVHRAAKVDPEAEAKRRGEFEALRAAVLSRKAPSPVTEEEDGGGEGSESGDSW